MSEALVQTETQAITLPKRLDEVQFIYLRYGTSDAFPEATDRGRYNRHVLFNFVTGLTLLVLFIIGLNAASTALVVATMLAAVSGCFAWARYEKSGGYLAPSARAWLRSHATEFQDLRRRVDLHNDAFRSVLGTQNQLSEHPEMLEGLSRFWEEKRAPLQAEVTAFVGQVTALAKQEFEPRKARRDRIHQFREDVTALLRMERSIAAYDTPGFQATRDLTLFVSAAAMRRRLEEERDALGLKSKALPPIAPASRKLLAACPET